jgi:hypothetical protein
MKSVRISREAVAALFALVDEDISAVVWEEEMAAEVAEIDALIVQELGDLAGVDGLVEEAERVFAAAEAAESFRVTRELTDPVRARRAHRRTDRVVLRGLAADAGEAA